MLRSVATGLLALALSLGGAGLAFGNANPSGTGPPSQTCLTPSATAEPGHASNSTGSPFNETLPGNGGTHYSPNSQYDVACYQQTQHNH
ncbi:hypothetical protein ACFW1A_15750 [Kitasatospora sp. NPDC058965]|uniref:hypothetical protein n=1 Tax=Kitasatospora sp. NPDC058965 TaxID=3346682 RepID=UPI0036786CAE